jgi:hypothetical protein
VKAALYVFGARGTDDAVRDRQIERGNEAAQELDSGVFVL